MEIIPSYWQSITLNDLNNKAAMQTRMDRKYIVDADYAASVLAELPAEASVLEIEGQREFAYDSVYFDTPNLVSYYAAAPTAPTGSRCAPAATSTPTHASWRSRPKANAP